MSGVSPNYDQNKNSKFISHCLPYNLYCVGGDVKPCSINQSLMNE